MEIKDKEMNYRVLNLKGTRIIPSSKLAITFTTMKPLQKHFTVAGSALVSKLHLSSVGQFTPGLKIYALPFKRQRVTANI